MKRQTRQKDNNILSNILILALGSLLPPAIYGVSMVVAVLLVKVAFFLVLFLLLGIIYLNRTFIKNAFSTRPIILIAIFVFYAFIAYRTVPTSGKIGYYYGWNIPHEYSNKHWYFLNRISVLYPFDRTGLAYVESGKNLTIPPGYRTVRPVTKDGWYGITTYRFLAWTIIDILLYALATSLLVYKHLKFNHEK